MGYQEDFLRNMFESIKDRQREKANVRNNYSGAQQTRLTSSWATNSGSGDTIIRNNIRLLRARARELSRNNDYAKKYLRMAVINVLGSNGITFQNKAKTPSGNDFDRKANDSIEKSWAEWGQRINSPEVTGRLSWRGIQKMVIRSTERDGEVLVRKVRNFKNPSRFSLQLMEADHLDETLNRLLPNGNEIRMGVELDTWKRPIAYHLLQNHPGDYSFGKGYAKKYTVVPASDIIHVFDPDRIYDTRGITSMHTAMFRMHMLNGYEDAELVAARVSAAKMGFIKTADGTMSGDGEDSDNNVLIDADPGSFQMLPEGTEMQMFDPQHPGGNFPPFVKQMLRGMASGLNVSYNSLASDLESVNFSSMRSGTLEERDNWREKQATFIEDFCDIVYVDWFAMWLLLPGNPYRLSDYARLYAPKWSARSWAWVDPLKDMKANIEALKAHLTTYTSVLAEQGIDLEDFLDTIKAERAEFEKRGIPYDLEDKGVNSKDYQDLLDEQLQQETKGGNGNGNGKH